MTDVAENSMILLASIEHSEGWKYNLQAQVKREPGAPHPAPPKDQLETFEKIVVIPADTLVQLKLISTDLRGKQLEVDDPLVFKTPSDRSTGFLLRWHTYGNMKPRDTRLVILDVVDPDTISFTIDSE